MGIFRWLKGKGKESEEEKRKLARERGEIVSSAHMQSKESIKEKEGEATLSPSNSMEKSEEIKKAEQRMACAASKTGTSEFMQLSSNEIVHSGQLGPCIAIGIYNPKTGRGYLIHSVNMNQISIPREILKIKQKEGDLSEIRVIAAGNSLVSEEFSDSRAIVNREYVIDALPKSLAAAGAQPKINYKWLADNFVGDLYVDCKESKFYLESHKETFNERGYLLESDKNIEVY